MEQEIEFSVNYIYYHLISKKESNRKTHLNNPITYSLTNHQPNSELYYKRVSEFTDEVLNHAAESLMPTVSEFMEYIKEFNLESLRQPEEYLLELLSFGLLWKSYACHALAVHKAPFVTLIRLADLRKNDHRFKPLTDFVRGILITLFLFPKTKKQKPKMLPSLRDIDRLCIWLEATGVFYEHALRFIRWRAYWDTIPEPLRTAMAIKIFEFTDWFILRAEQSLGEFTINVDDFLIRRGNHYRWREDRVQCTRSRAEYHLNMIGAEIMNRSYRKDFLATETKAVLIPGCMRARPSGECEAVKVREGLHCQGCMPECHVNQLREMGKKRNFEVYIIPHSSDLSLWSPKDGQLSRGIVAAACVTTLLEGGWELKRYDVPAQCVLLDYSGCKKHWHPEGLPTELNVRQMKHMLDYNHHATTNMRD